MGNRAAEGLELGRSLTAATPVPTSASRSTSRRTPVLLLGGVIAVLLLVIGFLVVRHLAIQVATVSGESMEPLLRSGDRVVLDKITFRLRSVERGDVVMVEPDVGVEDVPTNNVKRVVAFEGESVSIEGGGVAIDGEMLDEPYARGESASTTCVRDDPCVVPDDHVFVLGDNRLASADSRTFGPVPADRISGLVAARVWPPGRVGSL